MAGRSSGNGVWVLITILSFLCLGLVTSTFYFVSKHNATNSMLETMRTDTEAFVKESERGNDKVRRAMEVAGNDRKSVLMYLIDSKEELTRAMTGSPRDALETVRSKVASAGANANDLLGQFREANNTIAAKDQEITSIEADRTQALTDRENEIGRTQALRDAHAEQLAAVTGQMESYRGEIEKIRTGLTDISTTADDQIKAIESRHQDQLESLRSDNRELVVSNQELKKRLRDQQEKNRGEINLGDPEEALVDGKVIGVDGSTNTVTINRGRQNRIRLGMTFAVYSRPSAIAPNAAGQYAAPKARLEVIRINETSADARIIALQSGQAVVREDVLANAVYDPNKLYTFVVFGNFDANGDGVATPLESDQIRAQISQWGGKNTDALTGDVDFVVLGQRPIVPPAPSVNASTVQVKEWERIYSMARTYDELFDDARATFIPVLNQNRFYTLIGKRDGDLR